MKNFFLALCFVSLAVPGFAAKKNCEGTVTSEGHCIQVMQNAEGEIIYTGSAASLGPETIALIISLGLGFLLIDSGSSSN